MSHKLDSTLLERDLVGACPWQAELVDQVRLHPADFCDGRAATVFAALSSLHERGEQLDSLNLRVELERAGKLTQVGEEYLAAIGNRSNVFSPMALDRLHELAELRRFRKRFVDAIAYCEAGDLESVHATCEVAISGQDVFQRGRSSSLREAAHEALTRVYQRSIASKGGNASMTLGLQCLDFAVGGVEPGNMVVVGADTGVGKSSLALTMALAQERKGLTAGIVSCEDSLSVWGERAAARWSSVSALRMRTQLSREELMQLSALIERMPEPRVFLEVQIGKNEHDVCAAMRRLVRQRGAQVLYVDYLQTIASSNRGAMRKDQVREIAAKLKGQADSLGVPLVLLSQLSRPQKGERNREPTKHDLKESGDIENAAEVIVLLWIESEKPNTLNLKIDKCKWGARRTLFQVERDRSGTLIEIEQFATGPYQEEFGYESA
jgi:replicative DNA helicase